MTIEDILKQARVIWGDRPMALSHIASVIGVVYGDICRQTRSQIEQGTIDEAELKKELGNLITSCIRWCDDLGFDPQECIALSQQAQARYAQHAKF